MFAVANCFAIFQKMFGELVRQNLRSPRTGPPRTTFAANDRQIFSRERIFWRTVRQFAAEYGRTRSNLGELRRTPPNVRRTPANVRRSSAGCRCWRTVGEFARSSPEFARVRANSPEFAANDSSPGILPSFLLSNRMADKRLMMEAEAMDHWVPQTRPIRESIIIHPHMTTESPLSLYCSIDGNNEITGRQIVVFLLINLGTLVETPVIMRTDGKHFCFLKCENENDLNKLLRSLSCCDGC